MGYRRGFKTEANWYAREMRRELRLQPHDPLCPWNLARHLDYTIVKLSEYTNLEPQAVAYLQSSVGQKEFSAITLHDTGIRCIIHNDAHHRRRQASDISHELAHGLLLHMPAPLLAANGARSFNRDQEDEAHWLGPALLISEEAALYIVESGRFIEHVCDEYCVSEELLQMRLRVTGAIVRVARRRAA